VITSRKAERILVYSVMVDKLTKEHRSWNMGRIRSENTKPEKIIRSYLHRLGYRFRLHGRVSKRFHPKGLLPGKPDIVLVKYNTVVFANGCFWHRHQGCSETTTPKSRTDWWANKFNKNVERDKKKYLELKQLGWKVLIVWGCETKPSLIKNTIDKLHGGIQSE
jgi:DNA mismatch endonuclease, patch repair protein